MVVFIGLSGSVEMSRLIRNKTRITHKIIEIIRCSSDHVHNWLKVYLASIALGLFQFDSGADIFKLYVMHVQMANGCHYYPQAKFTIACVP